MKEPRCPGCKGMVLDGDWTDHIECRNERSKARKYDETNNDDYPEPRETVA